MTLEELATHYGLDIVIEFVDTRWKCYFKNVRIHNYDTNIIWKDFFADGRTPMSSMIEYIASIRGKALLRADGTFIVRVPLELTI